MRYYSDPTLKDAMTEIESIQKKLDELKSGMLTGGNYSNTTSTSVMTEIVAVKKQVEELKSGLGSFSYPTKSNVMEAIAGVKKEIEGLKPRLLTAEHFAQLAAWASLKQDMLEIKNSIALLASRSSHTGIEIPSSGDAHNRRQVKGGPLP